MERTKALILVTVFLALAGCDNGGPGREAYDQGLFDDATAAFGQAVDAAGEDASAVLHYNHALAALRAGNLRVAENAAKKAETSGGPGFAGRAALLRGNIAFTTAALAERQAGTVQAEPFGLDIAIAYAKSALAQWGIAAMEGPDRAVARRNVERALLAIDAFTKKKKEAEKKADPRPEPKPAPIPPPPDPDRAEEEQPMEDPTRKALSPDRVLRLFEVLAKKEKEKLDVRRRHRKERMREVEKDW